MSQKPGLIKKIRDPYHKMLWFDLKIPNTFKMAQSLRPSKKSNRLGNGLVAWGEGKGVELSGRVPEIPYRIGDGPRRGLFPGPFYPAGDRLSIDYPAQHGPQPYKKQEEGCLIHQGTSPRFSARWVPQGDPPQSRESSTQP